MDKFDFLFTFDLSSIPLTWNVFNEFVIRLSKSAQEFQAFARERGVLAGLNMEGIAGCGANDLLVAVTEKRTAAEIETAVLASDFLARFGEGKSAKKVIVVPGRMVNVVV